MLPWLAFARDPAAPGSWREIEGWLDVINYESGIVTGQRVMGTSKPQPGWTTRFTHQLDSWAKRFFEDRKPSSWRLVHLDAEHDIAAACFETSLSVKEEMCHVMTREAKKQLTPDERAAVQRACFAVMQQPEHKDRANKLEPVLGSPFDDERLTPQLLDVSDGIPDIKYP